MDYLFVTKKTDENGVEWAGERIHAKRWEEAEDRAQQLGVEALGILYEEVITYNYE